MKKYLLIILTCSGAALGQYTTPNTGVNWNLDSLVEYSGGVLTGSFPSYNLNNNIIISANDTLAIQAGAIIACDQSASGFEVNGFFTSAGTAADSVLFTSPSADSTGAYEGIVFNEGSSGVIQYTIIEYASYGMRCINASPSILNSHIYKCDRGVQLSGSDAVILNNIIERSYEYGVLINLSSNPDIENNIISHNNTQNTSAKNQISIGLQGNNSPIIKNNEIFGGSSQVTGGISLWVSGSSNYSNMVCKGNIIHDNSFGITLYSTSDGVVNAIIEDNLIYDNNLNPNPMVSGSGININGSSFNTPVIRHNEIYGNFWGITIQNGTVVQAGPNPNIGNIENSDSTDDGLNIIHDNIQGSDVFDLYNNCTNDIMAQNNDWGVYDSTLIEQHIFHKVDDPTHGLVIFMPFQTPVPVELTGFNAGVSGSKIVLNWKTSTETNNKGFSVERRLSNKIHWTEIGFVAGKGTTTNKNSYIFVDNDILPGHYLYRLKQIDFNGSFKYSQTVEVDFVLPSGYSLYQNYPNPFNPATIIKYSIPPDGTGIMKHVQLKVYDILGNEVAVLVDNIQSPGEYSVQFNGSNLSSGIYLYKLNTGDFTSIHKMLLLR